MQKIIGYRKHPGTSTYILPYEPIYEECGPTQVDRWHIMGNGKALYGAKTGFEGERAVSGKNYIPSIDREGTHHILTTKKRKKK